jgi:hypothetical protein
VPRPETGISARSKALTPGPEGRNGAGRDEIYADRPPDWARLGAFAGDRRASPLHPDIGEEGVPDPGEVDGSRERCSGRAGRLPAARIGCDHAHSVEGLRPRHRVTLRTCVAPGAFRSPGRPRRAGHPCAPRPAPPPSRHPSTALFASEHALKRLQRHLTTFNGRGVRFDSTRPDRGLTPPPYAPVGSLHQVGAGALRGPYAAPALITSLGGCNEGDLPRNPLREEVTDTLDPRGRHPRLGLDGARMCNMCRAAESPASDEA